MTHYDCPARSIMALFEVFGPDLLACILKEWIEWSDLVHLDSALCNTEARPNFFSVLQMTKKMDMKLYRKAEFEAIDIKFQMMNRWMMKRHLSISSWHSSLDLYEQYVRSIESHASLPIHSLTITAANNLDRSRINDFDFLSITKLPTLRQLKLHLTSNGYFSDMELSRTRVRMMSPILRNLSVLSIHHCTVHFDIVATLASELACIQHLSLNNAFEEPDILTALFIDYHLPQLISLRLENPILHAPDWSIISKEKMSSRILPHFRCAHTALTIAILIAPLVPNLEYVDKSTPRSAFAPKDLTTLATYCPRIRYFLLEMSGLPAVHSINLLMTISTTLIPSWRNLKYLYLGFHFSARELMQPVLDSMVQHLTCLQAFYLIFSKPCGDSSMSTRADQAHCDCWGNFWIQLLQNNKSLLFLEAQYVPINIGDLAIYGKALKTIVLINTTLNLASSQQSIALRNIVNFPAQFDTCGSSCSIRSLYLKDDFITDDIAKDFLRVWSKHHAKLTSIKSLTILSDVITHHVFQELLYLPDAMAHQWQNLLLSCEWTTLFTPLVEHVARRYCAPSGSLKRFSIFASCSSPAICLSRSALTTEAQRWAKNLLNSGIYPSSFPTIVFCDALNADPFYVPPPLNDAVFFNDRYHE